MSGPKTAVVLLSGGLDSAVTLAVAQSRGFSTHALSFRYGQRHGIELEAATRVAQAAKVASHRIIPLDLRAIGGSALTDEIPVPKDGVQPGIPVTYVPARNSVFLSIALGLAEVLDASVIFTGVNAVDYSGYPDCRPEFLAAFEQLAALAIRPRGTSISIGAPLVTKSKREIVEWGKKLGVDFSLTHSCYDPWPTGEACGSCDSCRIRAAAFRDAGLPDPTRYAPGSPDDLRRFYLRQCAEIAQKHSKGRGDVAAEIASEIRQQR